jgi:hypothetical protein
MLCVDQKPVPIQDPGLVKERKKGLERGVLVNVEDQRGLRSMGSQKALVSLLVDHLFLVIELPLTVDTEDQGMLQALGSGCTLSLWKVDVQRGGNEGGSQDEKS